MFWTQFSQEEVEIPLNHLMEGFQSLGLVLREITPNLSDKPGGFRAELEVIRCPRNKDAEGTEKRLAEREGSREMWCLRSSWKQLIQRKERPHC